MAQNTASISTAPATPVLDPATDPLIERTRTVWSSGNFDRIAVGYAAGAAAFVDRLEIAPGEYVLDVACGTGNLTLPAARRGARVVGVDIAPNLIETARAAAREAGLDARFDVGVAEALAYETGTFDTVISMFGVMFSPYPEPSLAELLRVTRPGGRIALANWTPDGFIGSMLRAHTALVPPPAGVPSVLQWGDEAAMRARLERHDGAYRDVTFTPRTIVFRFPVPPEGVVQLFREFYGPSVRTFGALDEAGRAQLTATLAALWDGRNRATDGTTDVEGEYLEVRVVK